MIPQHEDALAKPPVPVQTGEAIVRRVIYCHLVAAAVCLSLSLADRGLLVNHAVLNFVEQYLFGFILPAIMAWLICPVVLLITLACFPVSKPTCVMGVIAEVLLCVTHLYVLQPLVSSP